MVYVRVIALGDFATSDSTGTITVKKGEVLDLKLSTAARLINQGLVKKYRPIREDKEE